MLVYVSALLLFETLTGLSIYLLPFSVSNQVTVLVHTVVGLLFILPYAWHHLRHWRMYQSTRMTNVKLTGYFAMVATVVAAVSGLVLTAQAVLGTRISCAWDTIHIVATFAVIASVLPHVLTLVVYSLKGRKAEAAHVRAAEKQLGWQSLMVTAVLLAVVGLAAYSYEPISLVNELPEDYSYLFGADRLFAPSLARTSTGTAFDTRSMAGSESMKATMRIVWPHRGHARGPISKMRRNNSAQRRRVDACVGFARSTSQRWHLSFRASEYQMVTIRGLEFFDGDDEVFRPFVPYEGPATMRMVCPQPLLGYGIGIYFPHIPSIPQVGVP